MNNTTKHGGYVYPRELPDIVCTPEEVARIVHEYSGMTLRDAAALAALPAILQVCAGDKPREIGTETHEQMFARKAWAVADAFIAAREGKTNE